MSSNPLRLQLLFRKYVAKTITKPELHEFWELLAEVSDNDLMDEELENFWNLQQPTFPLSSEVNGERILQDKVFERAKEREIDYVKLHKKPVRLWKYAAAAMLVLTLGSSAYLFFKSKRNAPENFAQAGMKHDAAPGTTKAVLTLADGSKIILDPEKTGLLAQQGSMDVKSKNGHLSYSGKARTNTVLYNTLTTQRGEQSPPLTLSDGTKVWLNAASSITFPVAFTGNERMVEVTGEPYFEVAKDATRPFRVKVKDLVVEVLGTHFNINAYSDEGDTKTTLLEGSVKIRKGNQQILLQPGQQAQAGYGTIKVVSDVNIDGVMAWKNGLFNFASTDLPTMMRQLSRWYDLEVSYEGAVPKKSITGKVPRNVNASEVLSILDYVGVKFRIENKKVIITQ